MQVTINQVKPGKDGWTTFEGSGEVFTLPPDKGTVAKGGVYEVAFREKETQWGKKKYVTTLTQLKAPTPSVTAAPTIAPATNGNGKHLTPETFEKKELWMARMAALKASVEMVKAHVEMSKDEVMNPIEALSEIQKRYYASFLQELTK